MTLILTQHTATASKPDRSKSGCRSPLGSPVGGQLKPLPPSCTSKV